jgi:hypothetical protein
MQEPTFQSELECLINRYSQEQASNTPDFILAGYLESVLEAYNQTVTKRDDWFGIRSVFEIADKKVLNANLNITCEKQ